MNLKTLHDHSVLRQRASRIRMRRKTTTRTIPVERHPRVWSLLLPPRYPADRR